MAYTPRIVSYAYADSDGQDHGWPIVAPPFASVSSIGVNENGNYMVVRPLTCLPFYAPESANDQLRDWAAKLSAYCAGAYLFDYDSGTRRLTMSTTNLQVFQPILPEATAKWTGFTQTFAIGDFRHTWTAQDAPAAVCELYGITVEPAEDAARIDLAQYRHGRATAIGWGNHDTIAVTLYVRSKDASTFVAASKFAVPYLMTGRVRIVQGGDNNPISVTAPGGWVDGFVIASTDLLEDGDMGELWTVNLLVAVHRG